MNFLFINIGLKYAIILVTACKVTLFFISGKILSCFFYRNSTFLLFGAHAALDKEDNQEGIH